MIKKIMYFILVIAIGIAVYYVDYNNKQYQHVLNILNTKLEEKNYVDVARIFGGLFDGNSLVDYKNDGDKLDLVVYPSTALSQFDFGDDKKEDIHFTYEKSYAVYLYDINFDLASYVDESLGTSVNYSGIKFISNDNEYNYYFIVNSTMNNAFYKKSPNDFTEALLNSSRDYVTTFENIGFMSINFTECMIEELVDELDGDIEKIQIMDSKGESIYETELNFNFNEQFFKDCNEMILKYDEYLLKLKAFENDKKKSEELRSNFEKDYAVWLEEYKNFNQPTYTYSFDEEYLNPKSLRTKTYGTMAIYTSIAIVLYFLLLERKLVKKLIFKILRKPLEDEDDDILEDDYSIEDDMIDVDNGKSETEEIENNEEIQKNKE